MPVEVELTREFLDDKHRWKVYSVTQKGQNDFRDYDTLKSYLSSLEVWYKPARRHSHLSATRVGNFPAGLSF
jgi:hypothetical protein